MNAIIGLFVGVFSLFSATGFAQQVPLDEFRQLEYRIDNFERLLASEGLISLHFDLKKLGQELRELRGVVEVNTQHIEQLRHSQINQYQNLDRQLKQLGKEIELLTGNAQKLQARIAILETARGEVLKRLAVSLEPAKRVSATRNDEDLVVDVTSNTASYGVVNNAALGDTPMPDDGSDALVLESSSDALVPEEGEPAATSTTQTATSNGTEGADVVPSTPVTTTTALLAEQHAYRIAFEQFKNGHYGRAADSFREFLRQYPRSDLAGNAQYWRGESFYVEHDYELAIEEFKKVLDKYPESSKLTAAMLKIGFAHGELGQLEEARKVLTEITRSYPDSTIEELARRRLKRISEQ